MAIMLRKGSSMVTDWGLFFSIGHQKTCFFWRFNGSTAPDIGHKKVLFLHSNDEKFENDMILQMINVESGTEFETEIEPLKDNSPILPTGDSVITEHGFYILNKENKLFIWRDNGTDSPAVGKNKVLELGLNLVGSEDEFLAQFHDFEAEEELKAKHMGVLEWVILIAFTCYMIWLGFFKAW